MKNRKSLTLLIAPWLLTPPFPHPVSQKYGLPFTLVIVAQ
jgi:hypothetical protein